MFVLSGKKPDSLSRQPVLETPTSNLIASPWRHAVTKVAARAIEWREEHAFAPLQALINLRTLIPESVCLVPQVDN